MCVIIILSSSVILSYTDRINITYYATRILFTSALNIDWHERERCTLFSRYISYRMSTLVMAAYILFCISHFRCVIYGCKTRFPSLSLISELATIYSIGQGRRLLPNQSTNRHKHNSNFKQEQLRSNKLSLTALYDNT